MGSCGLNTDGLLGCLICSAEESSSSPFSPAPSRLKEERVSKVSAFPFEFPQIILMLKATHWNRFISVFWIFPIFPPPGRMLCFRHLKWDLTITKCELIWFKKQSKGDPPWTACWTAGHEVKPISSQARKKQVCYREYWTQGQFTRSINNFIGPWVKKSCRRENRINSYHSHTPVAKTTVRQSKPGQCKDPEQIVLFSQCTSLPLLIFTFFLCIFFPYSTCSFFFSCSFVRCLRLRWAREVWGNAVLACAFLLFVNVQLPVLMLNKTIFLNKRKYRSHVYKKRATIGFKTQCCLDIGIVGLFNVGLLNVKTAFFYCQGMKRGIEYCFFFFF